MNIPETEVSIRVFDKDHTCIVSGSYTPPAKATMFEPGEPEEFELVLTTQDGRDISEILTFDIVFDEVVKQLKQLRE